MGSLWALVAMSSVALALVGGGVYGDILVLSDITKCPQNTADTTQGLGQATVNVTRHDVWCRAGEAGMGFFSLTILGFVLEIIAIFAWKVE